MMCWNCSPPPTASADGISAGRCSSITSRTPRAGSARRTAATAPKAKTADSDIDRYVMLNETQLLAGAQAGGRVERPHVLHRRQRPRPDQSRSRARGPRGPQSQSRIWPSHLLLPGALDSRSSALELKEAGVDRINHNLNTSRRFYPEICTTHTYQDRLETLGSQAKPASNCAAD
jgi:biotin synthase